MNQLQLYINDQLVDLSDDSPIALTFQINNLAEVKNQQGNTSNQFKLPLTQRNRQILGFPDEIAFTTNAPYDNYQAKIVQDGLEIIPYGIAVLNNVEQDNAAITVLSGNVDFFDAIDNKIYDMFMGSLVKGDFKDYEHLWTVDNIVASQKNTGGWIWPVIDYGNINYNITGINEIDVRNLRPGFFVKTAIDIIVKAAGYKAEGSLLSNPLYPLLIVQFSNDSFEHGTDYQTSLDNASAVLNKSSNQPINPNKNSAQTGTITFTGVDASNPELYQNSTYKAAATVTLAVEFKYGIQVIDTTTAGGSEPYIDVRIIKYSNGSSSVISNLEHRATSRASSGVFGSGVGHKDGKPVDYLQQKQNVDLVLQAGESIGVEYYLWPNKDRIKGTFYGGASLSITNKQTNVVYGQTVQCERIFPDIGQKDLLKDVLQRFGIICQTNSATGTVNFASFRDIVDNIPIAKNWSRRCLDQGKGISFQLGGYAQVNYLKYKEDDTVTPKGFADAQINVADKTLPASGMLFESQFAPTLSRPYIGGSIAQIKMANSTDKDAEFSNSVSPRILINKTIDLRANNQRTIKFTDGNPSNDKYLNDVISVPYFYSSVEANSLLWEDLRKAYYPELEKILRQAKKVERYFMLTPRDILELDLLIPIYLEQDSAYYYINKIDSWRKGLPVKVELVKLG
ncbi:hypothetical protein A0256_22070 [Mucilaginibacter sp. PAMC 26640]|nr:hypothetical protein A0256_22070 [Mucilaginibacter sp. PAMC 26640]